MEQDRTPKQVARDIQACVNQIRNAMAEVGLLAGDEWGNTFEEGQAFLQKGLELLQGELEKAHNE